MRIERVEAEVFGPLKGDSLELAAGLTVVHGPNEAGKSSWHAALYAGLCGRRRGPGAGTKQDRAFAERHRPWHSDRWEVGVVLALADGRRVELRHDLAGAVECRATDLALGRDVSTEIVFDGAPDGSRWLGLNRRTMPATLCVRQADVLGVLDDPDQLQEALQRAAATGGTDATAEQALQAIAGFRRERIGVERRTSTKPLQRAIATAERSNRDLAAARAARDEYVRLVAERDAASARAAAARRRLDRALAARARAQVADLEQRLDRAEALAAQVGQEPPPDPGGDDPVADEVAAALAAHDARPEAAAPLDGPTAAELAAGLAAVPDPPRGDTTVAPEVAEAREAFALARRAVQAHERARPAERERPDTGDLDAADLRDLAATLEARLPSVDPALLAEVERLRAYAGRRTSPAAYALLAVGAVLAVAGVVALAAGLTAGGGALAVAGAAAIAGGAVTARRAAPAVSTATLASAETRLAVQQERRADAEARAGEATARLRAAGLAADAPALRARARELDDADAAVERLRAWREERDRLADEVAEAATVLWEVLRGRGEALADAPDPELAYHAYEHACRGRATQAAAAARREGLEARLTARRAAEDDAADRAARRASAVRALTRAAAAAGVDPDGDTDAVVARLRSWQARRSDERAAAARRREAWLELQHVLDGRDLDTLRAELGTLGAELEGRERQLAAGAPQGDEPGDWATVTAADLTRLEAEAAADAGRAHHLAGQVADRQRALPVVTEAEEALARAQEELARLRALDATLDTTRRFLEAARERVHRDIAPQLKAALERRLAVVTGGRYDQVAVDPATLQVRVRADGSAWQPATGLSHGTAEQVYLLLRLAMAEHLVTGGETAPLVLDDVTVQSDAERTEALLGLLHEASRDRQVILFSQETSVLAWAEAHLEPPRDSLVRLDPVPVAL